MVITKYRYNTIKCELKKKNYKKKFFLINHFHLRRLDLVFFSSSCHVLYLLANSNQDTFAYVIVFRVSLTRNI